MPWTVKDVDDFKKGLTPEQKKKWVKTANAVYKECMNKGGTDKKCAPKAIKTANSKFSEDEMKDDLKVPIGALRVHDAIIPDGTVTFAQSEEDGKIKLDMVANSGKPILNHWYWGNLGIDFQGGIFKSSKYPLLMDHMTGRPIGWTKKPIIDDNGLRFTENEAQLLSNEDAQKFIQNSQEGFPYQASIYGKPLKVEWIEEGTTTEVNGHKLRGPGAVWREWEYKESSVTVFGADSNTSSKVFNDTDDYMVLEGVTKLTESQEDDMTLEELKEKHPELFAAIEKDAEEKFNAKLADETKKLEALKSENEGLKTEVNKLSTANQVYDERLKALEEENQKRSLAAIGDKAQALWENKLKASEVIPESIYDKLSMPDHTKFIAEGVFDQAKFAEEADKEISDWEERLPKPTIMGFGAVGRSVDDNAPEVSKENADLVAKMAAKSGRKLKEDK
jgi:uncharacterized protein YdaT